jgi:predicted permease
MNLFDVQRTVLAPVLGATLLGALLSSLLRRLGGRRGASFARSAPLFLSQLLYRIAIPLAIINFVRGAEITLSTWIAPAAAWLATLIAIGSCLIVFQRPGEPPLPPASRKAFLLCGYLGNTSYLGFPVILLLPQLGERFFGIAVMYDIFGTILGAYGLGPWICSGFGGGPQDGATPLRRLAELPRLLLNPTLVAFLIGVALKPVPLPERLTTAMAVVAWSSIAVALLVMGMRLEQLSGGGQVRWACRAATIKLLVVPLVLATLLTAVGIDGPQRLVLVLQASMPCAFAALVLTETHDLDHRLTVTTLLISLVAAVPMLALWCGLLTTW